MVGHHPAVNPSHLSTISDGSNSPKYHPKRPLSRGPSPAAIRRGNPCGRAPHPRGPPTCRPTPTPKQQTPNPIPSNNPAHPGSDNHQTQQHLNLIPARRPNRRMKNLIDALHSRIVLFITPYLLKLQHSQNLPNRHRNAEFRDLILHYPAKARRADEYQRPRTKNQSNPPQNPQPNPELKTPPINTKSQKSQFRLHPCQ